MRRSSGGLVSADPWAGSAPPLGRAGAGRSSGGSCAVSVRAGWFGWSSGGSCAAAARASAGRSAGEVRLPSRAGPGAAWAPRRSPPRPAGRCSRARRAVRGLIDCSTPKWWHPEGSDTAVSPRWSGSMADIREAGVPASVWRCSLGGSLCCRASGGRWPPPEVTHSRRRCPRPQLHRECLVGRETRVRCETAARPDTATSPRGSGSSRVHADESSTNCVAIRCFVGSGRVGADGPEMIRPSGVPGRRIRRALVVTESGQVPPPPTPRRPGVRPPAGARGSGFAVAVEIARSL